jgi:hypothetical protein
MEMAIYAWRWRKCYFRLPGGPDAAGMMVRYWLSPNRVLSGDR